MSGGVSYYGSKISLVSNAGIRYEGHLFSVDTTDSTVTLSKVRSFGTEDRPCDHPVAQRDEMYDYIVFRASDIKDLLVCEGPKPPQSTSIAQDPAILQHSGAVSTTTTPSFRPPNTFATAPAPFAPFNQLPYQYGAIGGMMPNQFGAGQAQRPQMGVGRQTPPPNRKSPTMEQAVQASGPTSPDKDKNEGKGRKDHDKHDHHAPEPQPQRRRGSREEQRRINQRDNYRDTREEGRVRDNQDRYRDNQNRDFDRDGNRRRNDRGPREQVRRPDNQQQRDHQQQRDPQQQRDHQQQPYRRGRGGRGRGNRPQIAKDPIKVGTDFDFDSANAQFDKDAIEDEFESKLKIVNGDEKSSEHEHEGSGSETPTSENQDDKAFYEPEKSFFDSISCESTNQDGNRTRPSRREEYKMNTETFGVPFSRGRGRGRGGYYRGGYNRGGYNNYQGGYNRNSGGYRGRNNYQRGGSGGGGGGTAWNNRRNRNQDWGRGDAPQRRDRGDDNRRREEGISQSKGTTESTQKEDIKVAEGS